MVDYWCQDIEVTEHLFNHFHDIIWNSDWRKSLRAEHDVQIELVRSQYYGFFLINQRQSFFSTQYKQR